MASGITLTTTGETLLLLLLLLLVVVVSFWMLVTSLKYLWASNMLSSEVESSLLLHRPDPAVVW